MTLLKLCLQYRQVSLLFDLILLKVLLPCLIFFSKCLLSAYCVFSTVPGAGKAVVSKIDNFLALLRQLMNSVLKNCRTFLVIVLEVNGHWFVYLFDSSLFWPFLNYPGAWAPRLQACSHKGFKYIILWTCFSFWLISSDNYNNRLDSWIP